MMLAAAVARLTPTGWLAKAGVDVAAGVLRPAPSGMVGALEELVETRREVQRSSVLVNQAVAKWHATDELPSELLTAVGLVGRVLPRLEDAAVTLRRASSGRPPGGGPGVGG